MPRYEYKVVPAPTKGLKGKGVKGAEARFSHALQELMNGLSGYGWEYQRAETLPSIERSGLTSTTTEWRNVLVFRRVRTADAEDFTPELLPAPDEDEDDLPEPADAEEESIKPAAAAEMPGKDDKAPDPDQDNGVEDTTDVNGLSDSLTQFAEGRKSRKSED